MANAEGAAAKEAEHEVLYQGEAPPLPMVELETPALGVGREADARLVQELLEREPSLPLGEEIAKLKHIHASEDLRALAEHIEELEALHRTESDHRATASAFLDRLQAMARRGRQVLRRRNRQEGLALPLWSFLVRASSSSALSKTPVLGRRLILHLQAPAALAAAR